MTARIDLTDRHEEHPDSVKEYALEKVGRLEKFFDRLQHIEVVLDKEHDQHLVEVNVSAAHNLHFVGHASSDSVMTSIDRVCDKLERQVKKAKERLRDHRHR